MAQFLHIRVEDLDLLLPALQVHEVIGLDPEKRPGEAHALWREQVLASCDLGQILQRCDQPKSRAYGVVYSADETDAPPVMMLIDEVLGLRKPKPEQLHRLPGVKTDAHRWFEALCVDNQLGYKAYCVRSPLTPELWNEESH
jgi:chemotaxis signal transduction protein